MVIIEPFTFAGIYQVLEGVAGITILILNTQAILKKDKDTGFSIAGIAIGGYLALTLVANILILGLV